MVQPAPIPLSTKPLRIRRAKEGGNNQKLILLSRGKAISGAPNIIGINQFPKPPIIMGITIKKIMIKAWEVTITLYSWLSCNKLPGTVSSARIIKLIDNPNTLAQAPKRKYSVPISL